MKINSWVSTELAFSLFGTIVVIVLSSSTAHTEKTHGPRIIIGTLTGVNRKLEIEEQPKSPPEGWAIPPVFDPDKQRMLFIYFPSEKDNLDALPSDLSIETLE